MFTSLPDLSHKGLVAVNLDLKVRVRQMVSVFDERQTPTPSFT